MKKPYSEINNIEIIEYELRDLYASYGYSRFKMGKFEEYDLYTRNRDFVPSQDIIAVSGQNGGLLALRPDLTLSIVKSFSPDGNFSDKLYYSENIYRAGQYGDYREIRQIGLEYLGELNSSSICEVVLLAAKSLKRISKNFIMDLSHMGFILETMKNVSPQARPDFFKAIGEKNISEIERLGEIYNIPKEDVDIIKLLATSGGKYREVLNAFRKLKLSEPAISALDELEDICNILSKNKLSSGVNIDFSIVNNMTYYSGILFKGYVNGLPSGILSGGRYDGVMERMGKKGGAIGFAIYLDDLEEVINKGEEIYDGEDEYLNIALPKGRLGMRIYDIFEQSGYPCPDIKADNRKLVFENKRKKIRYFWVKPSDVTVYVERGTADIGACGKDVIEENSADIYELLDLKKGRCRMCVAAEKGYKEDTSRTLKVATKYPEIARKYYEGKSRNIDIIELHGSIELAPILKMSDVIVDIVETGKTLKENNLEIIDEILSISARLIANKSSLKFKNDKLNNLLDNLKKSV